MAVEGPDREAFLQGQLTQDVRGLAPGASRLAAGLTPKGKLLYFGTLVAEAGRFLLLLPEDAVGAAAAHLAKYAAFQKVSVRDATADYVRVALYGPGSAAVPLPAGAVRLPAEWEFAGEIVAAASARDQIFAGLAANDSIEVAEATAEVLRVEAGRPRLLRDATEANVLAELGLDAAISTTKGCYVGQEIVARMRTYGRASRRLVGFRFTAKHVSPGAIFTDPEKPSRELARVTSAATSPRFGSIGLGFASRDVSDGAELMQPGDTTPSAAVCGLPFA